MIFSKKKLPMQGKAVSINEGSKTPMERYKRAYSRVYNLTRKLDKHRARDVSLDAIAQTEFAINEWEKRMKVAEFELKLEKSQ